MRVYPVALLLLTLLTACQPITRPATATRAAPASNALVLAPLPNGAVDQYGLVELSIQTAMVAENPYDPDEIDLRVHFQGPDGKTLIVPAFWYQAFARNTLAPTGEAGWRVRFTPSTSGEWTAQAVIDAQGLVSEPISFVVNPSAARGFLRVHPDNTRYFAFDDGSFYFPIGLNLGWSTGDVLADYERWLDQLSANGGNLARVWMASWSFGIEWNDTGLGDYTARQRQAWLLDEVFRMAEERGVYLLLTLLNHGAFSTSVNPEWAQNPYNRDNGGPCPTPVCFVEDPTAREFFKRRLRYIAARWGYSPHLFAWEWWNEVNWTGIGDQDLAPWIEEMTATLAEFDPYDHLITNSYANGALTQIWQSAVLDFSQQHDYTGGDLIATLARDLRRIQRVAPDKPVFMGELGYSAGAQSELDALHLHTGLWAAPFLGYAGGSLYWWWDTFVDPQDQWGQYGSLAGFFAAEDLTTLTPLTATVAPDGAQALTLQGQERALVWVRSDAYSVPAAQAAYDSALREALKARQKLTEWSYEPPTLTGLTLTVTGLTDGAYRVQLYDPATGTPGAETSGEVINGMLALPLPPLQRDLALKIEPATTE